MSFFTNILTEGVQVAYGRFGFEGPQGSGKSTTAGLLAVGISVEYYNRAPVVVADSENSSSFLKPIFAAEKVPLLVIPTRSLSTLKEAVKKGEEEGACVMITDTMTRFWTTLVKNYMTEHKIPNFKYMLSHWNTVKEPWREWAEMFINCKLHMIACGRGGFEYDSVDVIDEATGEVNTETVKGDFKMKAEGEFGHEPDINIHFQSMTDPNAPRNVKTQTQLTVGKKKVKSAVQLKAPRKIHVATVQKGRVWAMNGKVFQWADRDIYKPGEYREVLDCFRPYLEALNIGGKQQQVQDGPSEFKRAETNGSYTKKVKILESWKTTMDLLFPDRKAITLQKRLATGIAITGGIKSAKEFQMQPLETLEFQYLVLQKFEERIKQEGMPDGDGWKDAIEQLVELARLEAGSDWEILRSMKGTPDSAQASTDQPAEQEVF